MLPWRNSWFQIAFFAWLVSSALLIIDYAPKISSNSGWMKAFQRAPGQPLPAPAKPSSPSESPAQAPTRQAPSPAQEKPTPDKSATKDATKEPTQTEQPAKITPPSPHELSAKDIVGDKKAITKKIFELLGPGGRPENNKAALAYATNVCDSGKVYGCTEEGMFLEPYGNFSYSGITPNAAKARTLFQKACDDGEPEGCSRLAGAALADGDGKTAIRLDIGLCKSGTEWDAIGCSGAFLIYAGQYPNAGVPKDASRALEFATKACTERKTALCLDFGDLYRDNTGNWARFITVSPDRAQAIAFYRKACAGSLKDGSEAIACLNLKQMNATDKGIAHDYAQSLTINRTGCNAKNWGDCKDLGIMYENGLGVPIDLNKAIALYTEACDGKNQEGCAAVKRLGK
jgi:TPR repeat protein